MLTTPPPGSEVECDAVSVDQAEECQPDPDKPCEGNPVKNPRIAPQTNSGVDGGRFRVGDEAVRNGGTTDHNGLDIQNGIDDNIYSMFSGNVVSTGTNPPGWGKFIIIKCKVDGDNRYFLFAHLKSFNVESGEEIQAGQIIGTAGETGNLDDAKDEGLATQHVHIEVRKYQSGTSFNDSKKEDPESYLKTKFDDNGNVKTNTDC